MFNISLTKRYIPATIILVIFLIASHLVRNHVANESQEFAKIINISGKQRMISQQLIVLAQDYYEDNSNKQYLIKALNKIRTAHKYLLTKILTPRIQHIYFKQSLDKDLEIYLKYFDNLIISNKPIFLQSARDSSKLILVKLDSIVGEYERYANSKLKEADDVEHNLLIITLILLLFGVFFIFRPTEKEIEKNTKILEQKAIYEKEQAKILIQQSKMAFMGEMLENISHQWRQPLSFISTAASGIQVEKEYGILKDEVLDKRLQNIIDHTESLSKTIEEFSNFFRPSKDKENFKVNELLGKIDNIVKSSFENEGIEIIQIFDKNIDIYCEGFKNELSQVIINILNNAKDIIFNKNIKDKIIKIELTEENNSINIKIFDSAGGISDDILPKIFDPYFTTKHKSQGTGLGLYMSSEIINNHFKGQLKATNKEFIVNDKNYYGACFELNIPIKV